MVIVQPVHCSSLLQLRFKIFPCSPHPLLFSNMSHIWAVLLLSHLHLTAARMKYGWFQSPSSPAAAPPRWRRTHRPAVPIVYCLSFGYVGRRMFSFISMFSISQTNRNLFTVQCEAVSSPMRKKTSQHQNSTPMITNLVLGLLLLVMHYCHNFL